MNHQEEVTGEDLRETLGEILYLMALEKIGTEEFPTHEDALRWLLDMEQETYAGAWCELIDMDQDEPAGTQERRQEFEGTFENLKKAYLVPAAGEVRRKLNAIRPKSWVDKLLGK